MHARKILGDKGFEEFLLSLKSPNSEQAKVTTVKEVLEMASKGSSIQEKIDGTQKKLFDY